MEYTDEDKQKIIARFNKLPDTLIINNTYTRAYISLYKVLLICNQDKSKYFLPYPPEQVRLIKEAPIVGYSKDGKCFANFSKVAYIKNYPILKKVSVKQLFNYLTKGKAL